MQHTSRNVPPSYKERAFYSSKRRIMTTPKSNSIIYLDVLKAQIVTLDRSSYEVSSVIENVKYPDGIAIDTEASKLYWTSMGLTHKELQFTDPDGSIWCSNLDGSERKMLVGNGNIYTPKQLLIHKLSNSLYWCDREGGRVMRSKLDGSHVEIIVQNSPETGYPKQESDQCVGIAIDDSLGKFYWTQKGPPKCGKGSIFSANIDMSKGETPSERSDVQMLLENLPEPIDLEIDKETNTLYWTDRGAEPYGNSLNKADITEHGLKEHKIVSKGFKEAIGCALDANFDAMYVSDLQGGNIYKVNLKSGEKKVVYENAEAITGIAIT